MKKLILGTDEKKDDQMQQEEFGHLQDQIKQQQAILNHLKWKESALI